MPYIVNDRIIYAHIDYIFINNKLINNIDYNIFNYLSPSVTVLHGGARNEEMRM